MQLFKMFATLGLNSQEFNQGIDTAGSAATGFGDLLKNVGKIAATAFAAASAAVVKFASDSIETGKKFDSSMSQVAATMGTTVDQITELRDFAQEMGRTTQFSAGQAADAMNVLAMAGFSAKQNMEALPEILNLAAAGGLEIATAADYATGIMAGFGMQTDQVGEISNKLAKIASSAKGDVASFGEGLSTVAGMASTTGQKIDDMTVALGILGNNNFSASEAGNALSRTLKNLYQPTESAAGAMEALGVNAYDAEGKAKPLQEVLLELNAALDGMSEQEKNQALSQIFDAATLKSIPALLNNAGDAWYDLETEVKGSWMTIEAFQQSLRDTGLNMESMKSQVRTLGVSYDDFDEALKLSGGDAEAFAELLLEWADAGVEYGDVVQALGGDLGTLQEAMDGTEGAAAKMAAVQLDNLAGDITLFQSAMEGAQIALSDQLTPAFREFVQYGTDAVSKLTDAFSSGGLEGMFAVLPEVMTQGIGMITSGIPKVISAAKEIISALMQGLYANLPLIAEGAVEIVSMLANTIIESVPDIMQAGTDIITSLSEGLVEGIPAFLEQALPMLLSFTENLRENFGTIVDAGIQFILNLVDGIIEALPTLWEYVPQIVSNIAGLINDNAPKLLGAGIELIARLITGIVNSIPLILQNFGTIVQMAVDVFLAFNWINLGSQLIDFIVNGVKALISALPDVISNIGQSAWDALSGIDWMDLGGQLIELICSGVNTLFTSLGDLLVEVGNDAWQAMKDIDWLDLGSKIIDGVVDGLSNAGGAIKDKLIGLGKDAWEGVKNFFGIKSPSRLMRDTVGKMIPLGLAAGIDAEADAVTDAMDRLGDLSMDAVDINGVNGEFDANRGGYNQVVNIYSPTELTPSEVARQTRNATRDMVLALNGV